MKRRSANRSARLSREASRLLRLTGGLMASASRAEDAYWETEIFGLLDKTLAAGNDVPVNQALDNLADTGDRAYDDLADLAESAASSLGLTAPETPLTLLVAAPLLVASSYEMPRVSLPAATLAALRVQLAAHVLADGVRFALADILFSPDQLPQSYAATRALLGQFADVLAVGSDLRVDAAGLADAGRYVADSRFLLAAVQVPRGHPLFRWHEGDLDRAAALAQWRAQAGPSLQAFLPGCQLELLHVDAFYPAWRNAERDGRPFALQAAVAYLQNALNLPVRQLRAVVAPYDEQRPVEWRVGLGRVGRPVGEVNYGVVWPLFGEEDDETAGETLVAALHHAGLGEVVLLTQSLPVEYCDDCGEPLFPTGEAESAHAEMPDAEGGPVSHHLH